jgi:hypothetical protein
LLNLMKKWKESMSGWATTGGKSPKEQLKGIRDLVAGALHSTECGRGSTRLIVMSAIKIVFMAETHIKIEGVVMREGDSCVQNSHWTIVDGVVVERPTGARVGFFSNDIDRDDFLSNAAGGLGRRALCQGDFGVGRVPERKRGAAQ